MQEARLRMDKVVLSVPGAVRPPLASLCHYVAEDGDRMG
jgi:hypothetical protein